MISDDQDGRLHRRDCAIVNAYVPIITVDLHHAQGSNWWKSREGCGEGVSLPTKERSGSGLCPLPRKRFDF